MLNDLGRESEYYFYVNWVILLTFSILISIGFLVQYSAGGGNLHPFLFHQSITFFISLPLLIVLFIVDSETIIKYSYKLYFISVLLLILVSLFGKKIMGATRWISIFGLTIQPSEIMKISMILALSSTFSKLYESKSINNVTALTYVLLITVIPVCLVLRQPNLGTAVVMCFIIFSILFAVGFHIKYFLYLGLCWLISLPIIWQFLYDYQKNRILTFMGLNEEDPLGKGYNILQSKIAIGSGGLFGKGFLEGTQTQLKFLPEKHSDFAFTVFTEELGFVGGLIIILTYFIFCFESLLIGIRSNNLFNRITAIGISIMFFSHYLINIGMVMGMLPVVGIPLPFISYGGSIMIVSIISVGVLLNIHKNDRARFIKVRSIRLR